jgi:hypothetical protein
MRKAARGASFVVATVATLLVVGGLTADEGGRRSVVIYPGDYVVQAGDVDASGAWREGVSPARVTVFPGETVVQVGDLDVLGRWRIDVDPYSGDATATAVTDRIRAESFEAPAELKEEVSPHLNITLISCTNCDGTVATFPRTIRVQGTFEPVLPVLPTTTWENPSTGWPSSPASSANVLSVSPGDFDPPAGPYAFGQYFGFQFNVDLVYPASIFSVYVDVNGDLVPAP